MPIYEYERPDGTTFELYQSFEEDALTKDPDTGVNVRRVFHAPAVHFKGKGFYNTDYGTRKRQREMASQNGDSASSSDGAKGEAKETNEGAKATSDSSKGSAATTSSNADGGGQAKKREPASSAKK